MALTIDDIYDKEFALKGGGYDRDDVDQFLDEICDEMTSMQEKMTSMEAELQKNKMELTAARETAKAVPQPVAVQEPEQAPAPVAKTSATLESILLSAQHLADEEVDKAKKQAADIVKEAQEQAGKIVDDAQEERETLEKSLSTLKASAAEYRNSFRELIKKHQEILEEDSNVFDK